MQLNSVGQFWYHVHQRTSDSVFNNELFQVTCHDEYLMKN